MLELSNRKIKH